MAELHSVGGVMLLVRARRWSDTGQKHRQAELLRVTENGFCNFFLNVCGIIHDFVCVFRLLNG